MQQNTQKIHYFSVIQALKIYVIITYIYKVQTLLIGLHIRTQYCFKFTLIVLQCTVLSNNSLLTVIS